MLTRVFFENTKDEAIKIEIERLNKYSSYIEGLRSAKDQAIKYWEEMNKRVNQLTEWKLIVNENRAILWRYQSNCTIIIYRSRVYFDEEINEHNSFARVIGAKSHHHDIIYGNMKEAISYAKKNLML